MMKTFLTAMVLVFAVTGAQAKSKGKAAKADATKTESYKVDTKESTVAWKGTKKAGSAHNGNISVKDGEVQVDSKGQITSGQINIDMATITNEDVKDAEYNKKLVGHLASNDFFDIAKYPTSSFKVLSVTPAANGQVTVKGELTMIGKTNPIEFPAKVTVDKGVATAEATVKVDRTKWGLKYGSGNFFKELTADKVINDEFEMNLKLVAKK
ncbi:YceI family protein [Bdellovibrio sp. SKB1291214]|uniref:YceI family protein n=1 Tax=Bdellovibrio sp. SKB1291214 TaxID=1732569 RepID=UPI000B515DF8|nr:YceI family protein [Bdellovibrio sp. SKB1291214]UYL09941.1 YceI family protein [Bdellovibrio sp. SKB1291214]